MKRALAAALLAVLLSAGCGKDTVLTTGQVISKDHHPAYTTYVEICVAYSKYGCTVYMQTPVNHPDAWYLQIRGISGHKTVTEWHRVDLADYESYNAGDRWPRESQP